MNSVANIVLGLQEYMQTEGVHFEHTLLTKVKRNEVIRPFET